MSDRRIEELDRLLDGIGREMAHRIERKRNRRRLARRVVLGGLAASIVVAAGLELTRTHPVPPAAASVSVGLDAESPRPFAVFETRDPDVTVVWLLEGE